MLAGNGKDAVVVRLGTVANIDLDVLDAHVPCGGVIKPDRAAVDHANGMAWTSSRAFL